MIYLFLLLIIPFVIWTPKGNYYAPKWQLFMALASAMLGFMVYEQSNIWLGLLFFWLGVSPSLAHYDYKNSFNPFLNLEMAKTGMAVFGSGILYLFLTRGMIDILITLLPALLLLDAIIVATPTKYRQLSKKAGGTCTLYGISGNTSVTSTTISIIYAMVLASDCHLYVKIAATLCVTWSLYKHQGSAGILSFLGSFFCWMIINQYWIALGLYILAIIPFCVKNWAYLKSASGRIEIWKKSLQLHTNWRQRVFGLGNGSYKIIMPASHKLFNSKHVTIWQHNDYVQFFLESGIIGMLILSCLLTSIGLNCTPEQQIIMIGLIPNVIFNFPLHMTVDTILIVVALKNYFLQA